MGAFPLIDLHCPTCKLALHTSEICFQCSNCGFSFKHEHGVMFDEKAYGKSLHELTDTKNSIGQWHKLIRKINAAKRDKFWLNQTVYHGNAAIKLLMPAITSLKVLHLGCSTGVLSEHIIKLARCFYGIDYDINNVVLASSRCALAKEHIDAKFIAIEDGRALPFDNGQFDIIVMSESWLVSPNHKNNSLLGNFNYRYQQSLINEMARILAQDGQILLLGKNKYSHFNLSKEQDNLGQYRLFSLLPHQIRRILGAKTTGFSFSQYTQILKKAGLGISNCYKVTKKNNVISALSKLDSESDSQPQSIKQHIKQATFTSPYFALLAGRNEQFKNVSLLEKITCDISQYLYDLSYAEIKNESLKFQAVHITGKSKAILLANQGHCHVVIKMPLEVHGIQGEANNYKILSQLQQSQHLSVQVPKPILRNEQSGQHYFVEELCQGEPLDKVLDKDNRQVIADEIFSTWNQMLQGYTEQNAQPETQTMFEFIVSPAIEKIANVTKHPEHLQQLVSYMAEHLDNDNIAFGLFHGDFSVGNVFMLNEKVQGIIDWEYGSILGPTILDLINIYTSIDRRVNRSDVVYNILTLISAEWPCSKEWQNLQQGLSLCGVKPEQSHAVFISLWFWAMDRQLDTEFVYDAHAISSKVDRFLELIPTYIDIK